LQRSNPQLFGKPLLIILMDQKEIVVSEDIRRVCPGFVGCAVYAEFKNSKRCDALWNEINASLNRYVSEYTTESIKEMPAIEATRTAYRRCGKDPSRYRPSGEALMRRVLKGKGLYQIDTAVDLINLASILYGYSIGGFDYDKISGSTITLGIGKAGEPYTGIGRGELNIEGLPVYRDSEGGIGTPTSDNERTKLGMESSRILAIVNGYDGNRKNVEQTARLIQRLLKDYADSDGGTVQWF